MRKLVVAALVLALASTPASAASIGDAVAGQEGVVFEALEDGTVQVAVERWDGDERTHVQVSSGSVEAEAGGRYFRSFSVEEDGYYRVTLRLGDETRTLRFRNKVRKLPKIGDSSYSADAGSGSLFLSPLEATSVDAEFLLTRDGEVIDSGEANNVVVSTPTGLERSWDEVPLDGGSEYVSVALLEADGGTRLLTDRFAARPDASLSSFSADEDSAELKVEGESQVPLDGSLRVTLRRDGSTVSESVRVLPPLLAGDSDEVEIIWNDVLEPGGYTAVAELMSGDATVAIGSVAFEARQDAKITDVFGDSNGATVTVGGDSGIPLDGSVEITLERGGEALQSTEVPAPVVLDGNEETVEVEWSGELEPGDYVVRAELDAVERTLDRAGNVFSVEEPAPTPSPTDEEQGAPGPGPLAALALAAAAYACRP